MTAARLSRAGCPGRPAAPVRLLHLGLGNFFRAHQAWYTGRLPDPEAWGYAAFAGRDTGLAPALTAQEGLYTLVTRARDDDRFEVIASLSRAHTAGHHDAWLGYFRSPELALVTITITEAGYLLDAGGHLDMGRPEIQADLDVLRRGADGLVRTAAGRLVAGLAARRRADAGPLALVPCDNVPGNGRRTAPMVRDLAELVDGELAAWLTDSVTVVTTVVDRITPRTTRHDIEVVEEATGFDDRCPVVTEPFHEWVLGGTFPAGRPPWQDVGATFTDDVTPFEHRKLWLLNGAHSLLAYAGSIRGHTTVAAAAADETCRCWLEEWWAVASAHLAPSDDGVAAYRAAVLERLGNTRINDQLERIAADGSQKLPIRILPVVRAERAAHRVPLGATRVLAAWICHLRGLGAAVHDARAAEVVPLAQGPLLPAAVRVLGWLEPALGADPDVTAAVVDQAEELAALARR